MMSTRGPIMAAEVRATDSSSDTQKADDRRRFLRRLSGLGAGVVGAIAFTWADAPGAAANPDLYHVGCCYLATTIACGGSWDNNGNFTCASGYHKYYWSCCCGNFIYHCWECAAGSNCDQGPWKCSNWWNYYLGGCCASGCPC